MARLPPLDALHVFAIAARNLSFTAAAAELHRTQSAVSHRIKSLEREIGVSLFRRHIRGLELTRAGEVLANKLNQAIADISRTISDLDRTDEARRLRVTMLPSVASRWLMPRLPRFCQQHPDIQVQVIAEARVTDLRAEGVDLAIRFGRGNYRQLDSIFLMKDWMLPVCQPQLLDGRPPVGTIDALLELPLLHDSAAEGDGSLSDWRSWLEQLGRPELAGHAGQRFSHAGLVIEAAALGLGVALARLSLVADHLSNRTLVCPLPLTTSTAFAYYLVALPEIAALPTTVRFMEWLQEEAKELAIVAARVQAQEMELRLALKVPPRAVETHSL